ncbi:DUF3108 domain-containing protein [Pseudobacteriovorax antillogorgiicola]|uniref:DUF3108 domain-containing protein n=1 Tax=Pseudobacteriovorax antillogorgiicola TaxID=1513793 RepID=UPI00135664D1|nr:DUF3108 domain-containing protein [Pseudobacteriovorax antillogorgiicola]
MAILAIGIMSQKGISNTKQDNFEQEVICPGKVAEAPQWSRSKTYQGVPYGYGEEARYELKYGSVRVHVGYGFMRVGKPLKYKIPVAKKNGQLVYEKRWHRVFSVEAYTGDWYKAIFQAHDKLQAFSRPWDGGISKFYISEDHDKPFEVRSRREKWLEFDHVNCSVKTVEEVKHKNKRKEGNYDVFPGAVDALGAAYKLRSLDFKVGEKQKFVVYTSEKNWWLEAMPLAEEKVQVKAGTFDAVKVNLITSAGQQFEQKGTVTMWLATNHPNKPLIKIEGEAKFGSFYLELDQFTPGKN